ncbi:MAG: hypothetical protein R2867_39800 [Caldilineaceae bacterium]
MSETTVGLAPMPSRTVRLAKFALQALVLLPFVAGFIAYRLWIAQPVATTAETAATATSIISAATLEERFGVRVTLIAVTAAGGIVDLRYRVLDKNKAEFLLGDPSNTPKLISDERGITLLPPGHATKHGTRLENDTSYYTFYPNTQTAVEPGMPVSVVFGSVQLEPIVAQ